MPVYTVLLLKFILNDPVYYGDIRSVGYWLPKTLPHILPLRSIYEILIPLRNPFGRFYYDCLISLQFGPSDHLTGVRKHFQPNLPNFDIFVDNIFGVILDFNGKRTPAMENSIH